MLEEVVVEVTVRVSPGGLCLDDGIHHRESPELLRLVAKTLCYVRLVCGGTGGTYCLLHTLFMLLKCFRKLHSTLQVFCIFFIVSRSCWH